MAADDPTLMTPVITPGVEVGDEGLGVEWALIRGASAPTLGIEMDMGNVLHHRGHGLQVVRQTRPTVTKDERHAGPD